MSPDPHLINDMASGAKNKLDFKSRVFWDQLPKFFIRTIFLCVHSFGKYVMCFYDITIFQK